MTRNVLLIGSIPLASANQVFLHVSQALDGLVQRIPDGECGERRDWIKWQSAAFSRVPFVEPVNSLHAIDTDHHQLPQFRVRPGYPTESVRFGPLGYASAAQTSYADFHSLKQNSELEAEARLLIGMATPLSVVGQYMDSAFQAAIEPAYEKRLLQEIDEITDNLPADELAIQWNLATELSIMAGHRPVYFDKIADGIIERLVRLCERVPDNVELGLHFCFQDFMLNHFPMPRDLDQLVDLANGVIASSARQIDWIHLPVTREVSDETYFEPLQRLMLPENAGLYLGLLHSEDGLEGATRRIALAGKVVKSFGIGAECGLGDISEKDIDAVLALHRDAAHLN